MCFHGNQLSWKIKHPVISLCLNYHSPGFIGFPTILAPVISSLDEIYCITQPSFLQMCVTQPSFLHCVSHNPIYEPPSDVVMSPAVMSLAVMSLGVMSPMVICPAVISPAIVSLAVSRPEVISLTVISQAVFRTGCRAAQRWPTIIICVLHKTGFSKH